MGREKSKCVADSCGVHGARSQKGTQQRRLSPSRYFSRCVSLRLSSSRRPLFKGRRDHRNEAWGSEEFLGPQSTCTFFRHTFTSDRSSAQSREKKAPPCCPPLVGSASRLEHVIRPTRERDCVRQLCNFFYPVAHDKLLLSLHPAELEANTNLTRHHRLNPSCLSPRPVNPSSIVPSSTKMNQMSFSSGSSFIKRAFSSVRTRLLAGRPCVVNAARSRARKIWRLYLRAVAL